MKRILGIDVGSTMSSVVVIDHHGAVLHSSYLFHQGQIHDTLLKQLSEIKLEKITGIGFTSSSKGVIKKGRKTDSRVAFITAAKYYHPKTEAILIIGAEKFGLVRFRENGEYRNYRGNTSCAAGTGSFLDQQLRRLNLNSIAQLGHLASSNTGEFPKIASRCSVFAKTDLIHAQQEGYSLAEICDGLCYGLAKNVIDTVFAEENVDSLVVAGGVSLNEGVLKHIRKITNAELTCDEYSHLYGSIGAALDELQHIKKPGGSESLKIEDPNDILKFTRENHKNANPPLELRLSEYPDFTSLEEYLFSSEKIKGMTPLEVSIYEEFPAGMQSKVYLGIDIGSTSTKAALLNEKKQVMAGFYTRTSGRPVNAVQTLFEAIDHLQQDKQHQFQVKGAGTTGSGRKLIGEIIKADTVPDEITAHARAARELDPETDTIIEIGGQDSKFTVMREGIVTLSIMNNVCAAGTGSFIEEQAQKLNCPLSEYSERASRASSPLTSDRCTVFMERDLNHYLNEGYETDELLASVLHSIRDNYLSKVSGKGRIGNRIFFQGATAKNKALVAAFEQKLQKPIRVSKFCHLTGAMGVALELHDKKLKETTFRGLEIWKSDIPVRTELCDLCTNHCKLRVAEISGETVAYGFLCGRDYDTKKYVKRDEDHFDLLKTHKKVFSLKTRRDTTAVTVGIPPALHLADERVLWQKFFDRFGIKTLSSDEYMTPVKDGKKIADAEFCSPVSAAYGHVHYLKDKADFIFLPVYMEKGKSISTSKKYCFYTQYISSILASSKDFRDNQRLLMPLVKSLRPESHAMNELKSMFHQMGYPEVKVKQVRSAYEEALEFYHLKQREWKQIYREKVRNDDLNIILLGRPYTILSRQMNSNIPEIIRKKGYQAFYMDMLPEDKSGQNASSSLVKVMTWKYASSIIKTAGQVVRSDKLYPVLVTSFKCTPDSFVIEYFKEIMEDSGKPYLILQLDEHDSSVGYETRIEAAIRSFRNHYENRRKFRTEKIRSEEKNLSGGKRSSGFIIDLNEILSDHGIDSLLFHKKHPDIEKDYDLSGLKAGATHKLNGKTILMPGWDLYAGKLMEAILKADGRDAALLPDTPGSIQRSLNTNTGQCLPLNVITQNAYEYINEKNMNPDAAAIWVPNGYLACNLTMFPHYMRKLLKRFDKKMSDVLVYPGTPGFYDFSVKMGVNAYLVYLFSGSIRKIACSIRPYEKVKGSTNHVVNTSRNLLYQAFLNQEPKEPVLEQIMHMFDEVKYEKKSRPKVAIFGDMYARDNDIFNQDLIGVIEENGGEALPTSYSEYLKIIIKQTEMRLYHEGRYLEHYNLRLLKYLIPFLENRYNKFFEKYIKTLNPLNDELFEILARHHLDLMHRGETVDNIMKIETLVRHYDDISLFVQTNPAYCCPSLVTQAMSAHIEKLTGIPVISIEYDGTHGAKNEDVVPYLKIGNSDFSERSDS